MLVELKLACADFTFPLLAHEQAFKLIALLGFRGVDIGLFEDRSQLQPSHVKPNPAASARALSQKVADAGLEFADIFFQAPSFEQMAANHPDAGALFLRRLEFALRCTATHLTGLPGVEWDGVPFETSLQRSADELAWRVEQARQAGVVYSVEAHFGSIVPTPQKAMQLLAATPA